MCYKTRLTKWLPLWNSKDVKVATNSKVKDTAEVEAESPPPPPPELPPLPLSDLGDFCPPEPGFWTWVVPPGVLLESLPPLMVFVGAEDDTGRGGREG